MSFYGRVLTFHVWICVSSRRKVTHFRRIKSIIIKYRYLYYQPILHTMAGSPPNRTIVCHAVPMRFGGFTRFQRILNLIRCRFYHYIFLYRYWEILRLNLQKLTLLEIIGIVGDSNHRPLNWLVIFIHWVQHLLYICIT